MVEPSVRVLLVISQDVLDRARTLAGNTTAALKLPVSLQVVLRSLIEEALKREDHPGLLATIEMQAKAVRQRRRAVRSIDPRELARRDGSRPGPPRRHA
jgi:hypothetical protein